MYKPDFFQHENTFILVKTGDLGEIAEIILQRLNRITPATPNPDQEEKPLTQEEAIKFLGKTRQTLSSWRRKGIIKAYRLGGRIYYKPSELIAALEKLS